MSPNQNVIKLSCDNSVRGSFLCVLYASLASTNPFRQWCSKVLMGPCAEIWLWALEIVFRLKQNKMDALKIILGADIALQLR